jgi:hypothetical protein
MYYIYHIPNVKIGCTNNIQRRVIKQQGYSEFEILEEHEDIDVASKRERELQKQYGYRIDTGYSSINKLNKINGARVSAKKQWTENRDSLIERSRKGGKTASIKSSKKVFMCDLDGNILMNFNNRKEAAKYVNGFPSTLKGVINHPTRTYKGYRWKDE